MLLIHFKLTQQNIVLQEAKKHFKKKSQGRRTWGKGLIEIRECLPPPQPYLQSCIRGLTFGWPFTVQNMTDITILELEGMKRLVSPTFREPIILEKPQRGNDWLRVIRQLYPHDM